VMLLDPVVDDPLVGQQVDPPTYSGSPWPGGLSGFWFGGWVAVSGLGTVSYSINGL